jgi:prepilin-type N-terminal cleavage/methylation domain-containing protein
MPSERNDAGFTLPELLVVTIIIGVLAAIALPTFVRQVDHGYDASAKSDSASLAGFVEQCSVETDNYTNCNTVVELFGSGSSGGLQWGNRPGQVRVAAAAARTYRIVARSQSGTNFTISRTATGVQQRRCNRRGQGGCPATGAW